MLNIDEIMNGVVIDHITAGTGLSLYHLLELEKLSEASVALLQNVRSQKSGKRKRRSSAGSRNTSGKTSDGRGEKSRDSGGNGACCGA